VKKPLNFRRTKTQPTKNVMETANQSAIYESVHVS
jgi:hypothetical protein